MPATLVRSRAMITKSRSRTECEEIADGALVQEDGVITAIGTYDDLRRKHPSLPVIGSGREIMLPGFVNAHHHVGLTPLQLGSPDMPLELWFVTRMVARNVNPYLDTLYSAFEMIGSGITTVQHLHGWAPGKLPDVEKRAGEIIRAYEDIGMRVSYCFALRDQNRLVYQADQDFIASLPAELQGPMQRCSVTFIAATTPSAACACNWRRPICIGVPTRPWPRWRSFHAAMMRRSTCIWWKPPIRRNMRAAAVAARRWNILIASACLGRI